MATQDAYGNEATPIPPAKRIDSIDTLRGLALLGVLAINLETEFRVSIFQQFVPGPPDPGLDGWVNAFLQVFVDLKALAVFSLLFGVGLAIQHERMDGDRRRLVLLLRRLLVLLAFGLIHLFLIWNGDILTEYALAGLVVLPFLFLPNRALGVGAAAFLTLYLVMPLLPLLVAFPDAAWLADHIRTAGRIYGSGGFSEILVFRIEEVRAFLPLHVFIFPRTVGLFLLGMLAWRAGIVQDAKRNARRLRLLGLLGIAIGLGIILAIGGSSYFGGSLGTIVLALGYAVLVVGVATGRSGRWPAWAEPVGRMAFTNYIVQSLILGCIFYGYGFGLFGKIGSTAGLILVLAIYIGQALFSRWWLSQFAYGPIEWLWRALMYGRSPPFRKVRLSASPAGP